MRRFLSILFLFVLVAIGCINNHKNTTGLSTRLASINDTIEILNHFFSPVRIIDKKIAVWKPTLDDYFNSAISDDSLCHSRIDTIIHLTDIKTIIVFRTEGYHNGKISDCHVCSPLYGIASVEKEDSAYNIVNFKKDLIAAGSFGNGYDSLFVEKFGKDHPLLCFSSSYVGNSTVTNTNTYFDLEYYQKVFDYWTYRSAGDSSELDPEYKVIEQHLIHIPAENNNEREDIKLIGNVTIFDQKQKKYVKKKRIEFYRADNFGNYKKTSN